MNHRAEHSNLEELHEKKRKETLIALEYLAIAQSNALLQLQKTQILFKYLNWKQQGFINKELAGNCSLEEICTISISAPESSARLIPYTAGALALPSAKIQRINALRKNMLQFGIIQARAAELIETIAKSAEVFRHQYKTCCRKLFPLGAVSRIQRNLKRAFKRPYFSWQDMRHLKDLGLAAAYVLKIAETPIMGSRS